MSAPSRNSILRSMGAEPKKKTRKAIPADEIHNDNHSGYQSESGNELDQVQRELDDQRKSSARPNSTYGNGNEWTIAHQQPQQPEEEEEDSEFQEVIPTQSRSSVVPPDEVLNRKDPVTRTVSQIQSRNLNLPPLASDEKRNANGDLIFNEKNQNKKNSLGKSAGGKLSKIFGGKKNSKDEIPVRDVRMKRYSERQTTEVENGNADDTADENGETTGGRDSRFIWANQPEPIPESQRIRSYRKPGAIIDSSQRALSKDAPQINKDVIHQDRIELEDDNGVYQDWERAVDEGEALMADSGVEESKVSRVRDREDVKDRKSRLIEYGCEIMRRGLDKCLHYIQ